MSLCCSHDIAAVTVLGAGSSACRVQISKWFNKHHVDVQVRNAHAYAPHLLHHFPVCVQVQQLEAQQQQKEKDVQRMRADVIKAQQQRDQARSDVERFRQEAALAETALSALNEQVAAARKQLNPLNHPLVRDFYKR
jgi:septal ring factor EnvC (AmiA/AmiB activator)